LDIFPLAVLQCQDTVAFHLAVISQTEVG
jgi:hypothetical protein